MLKKSAAATDTAAPVAAARPAAGGPRLTLKPSKNTCIALGATMGVLLAGSVGLYMWQSGEIAAEAVKVQEAQDTLHSSEKKARELEIVRRENGELKSELRFLESSVTEGQYVPTLLKQTEDLAKSTSLKVAALRPTLEPAPEPPADKEARKKWTPQPYDRLRIELDVSGKYWDVARMLYRMTEFPKILTVESMQVTPVGPKVGAAPQLAVKMRLTGFIFPTDASAVDPAKGAAPVSPATPASGTASAAAKPAAAPAATKSAAAPSTPGRKA